MSTSGHSSGTKPKIPFSWKMASERAIRDLEIDIKCFERCGNGNNAIEAKANLLKMKKNLKERYQIG